MEIQNNYQTEINRKIKRSKRLRTIVPSFFLAVSVGSAFYVKNKISNVPKYPEITERYDDLITTLDILKRAQDPTPDYEPKNEKAKRSLEMFRKNNISLERSIQELEKEVLKVESHSELKEYQKNTKDSARDIFTGSILGILSLCFVPYTLGYNNRQVKHYKNLKKDLESEKKSMGGFA